MTSLDWTKLGASPVGTSVSSFIAGNLPKAKKHLSNVSKILLVLYSLFKSYSIDEIQIEMAFYNITLIIYHFNFFSRKTEKVY